jgi:hypothetical protein
MRANKRGSIEDFVFIVVILIVLAIAVPIMLRVTGSLNTSIQDTDSVPDEFKTASASANTRMPTILDGIFIMLLVFTYVGTLILAFSIDTQPAFFFIATIMLIIMIFVIPFLANAYDDVSAAPVFASEVASLTIIPFVMANYMKIGIVMAFTIAMALYAKRVTA